MGGLIEVAHLRPPDNQKAALPGAALQTFSSSTITPEHSIASLATQRAGRYVARRYCLRIDLALVIVELAGIGGAP